MINASMLSEDLTRYSFKLGKAALQERAEKSVKELGQFLTPPVVARYMARQLGPLRNGGRLLEPAIGSGVLACAIIERLIAEKTPKEIWIDAFEVDAALAQVAKQALEFAAAQAAEYNILVHWQVYERDFVMACASATRPALFPSDGPGENAYDAIIANPPYFKLNQGDPRAKSVAGLVNGQTNIYTLFIAIAVKLLVAQGRACFIVPRSFCSGTYFARFRRDLIREARPVAFHLFDARDEVFDEDTILQETVIFTFERRSSVKSSLPAPESVIISTSRGPSSLATAPPLSRQVSRGLFLNQRNNQFLFRLPTGILDEQVLNVMDRWEGSFEEYGLEISTGPIVPFRSRPHMRDIDAVSRKEAVPLLWMQHVKPHLLEWPLKEFQKPQAFSLSTNDSQALLVPNSNYVVLRRFSAKEDRRRLIAAPFIGEAFIYPYIGLENHLNFIRRRLGALQAAEVRGLSALLNSAVVDRYFRIVNGNTQVNAADLRAIPLPQMSVIRQIGERSQAYDVSKLDMLVFEVLQATGYLPEDFPMIEETRLTMGKIEQAQEILRALGLPSAQQNEISALTLLVLAQLSEDSFWGEAKAQSLRVHDILQAIKVHYGREYAENTRETIRRQVLHQFEQAGIVVRNPEDFSLATNSPRTHYSLTEAVLHTLQTYDTADWNHTLQALKSERGTLLELYQRSREQSKVPLRLADGSEYRLSPGKHNQLQAAIVQEFGPRFAPGAELLYLGDAASKVLILNEARFQEFSIPLTGHGKLPDIILYVEQQKRLFAIEAVTSHGPVSPKRQLELEKLFGNCTMERIYVTAFPDLATFKRFLTDIAWETEVWVAEMPDHLIHFNGDRFLGSRA